MRKIIAILLTTCMFGAVTNVYAENANTVELKEKFKELNILTENDYTSEFEITREDCIVIIMRVIGVTDDDIDKLKASDFYPFVDVKLNSYESFANAGGIAYGEECIVDYDTYRTLHTQQNTDFFFFPSRKVTIKETLAFMVRCLSDSNGEDFNSTIEMAKKYELINDNDSFINEIESYIDEDTFYILIDRLLQQNRYKYYSNENNKINISGLVDYKRSISYQEMLYARTI